MRYFEIYDEKRDFVGLEALIEANTERQALQEFRDRFSPYELTMLHSREVSKAEYDEQVKRCEAYNG